MHRNHSLRTLLRGWFFCLSAWGLLVLLRASQFTGNASVPWDEVLHSAAADWLGWALVVPLIYLLTTFLPVEKTTWPRALSAHFLAGIFALAFVIAAHTFFAGPPQQPPMRPPPPMSPNMPPQFSPQMQRPPGPGEPPPDMRGFRPGPPGEPPPDAQPPRNAAAPDWFFRYRLPRQLPILFVVLAMSHALLFYKRGQEREKQTLELTAGLAQARLDALKMQIQPHFLFNALNSIAALVHKDANAADEMIGALSEFLRCTLTSSARHEVPLLEELEFVRRYLAIELVRFGDRLQCTQDVPPETFGALVPMLVLQPLVENAVRHGLSGVSGPARLTIRARRENGTLRLTVSDNGPGPGEKPEEGVGLANTRARLRELHGDAARVEIRTADGFTVELTLPFRTA